MLKDITIVIPTFHRRGYLRDCLDGIQKNLPECQVRIAQDDDGDCTLEQSAYNTYYWAKLPYDSGLTAKRNAAVRLVDTQYTLMGSDDFDFSTPEVREGIIRMVRILKSSEIDIGREIDVVAGRVNDRSYEGFLEYVPGEYIKEHALRNELPFRLKPFVLWEIDIAANYFLARTEVLRAMPWDESIKPIGGEHADWFLDLKEAGMKVVFSSPYANINQIPYDASKQHPDYNKLRCRAVTTGHALMMKKRNIKHYYGFDEQVK
jgi:hypothetical protein